MNTDPFESPDDYTDTLGPPPWAVESEEPEYHPENPFTDFPEED